MPTHYSTFLIESLQKQQQKILPIFSHHQGGTGRKWLQVVKAVVEKIYKYFGNIVIPSIAIILKGDLLFIIFLLLIYKFLQGEYELE